MKYLEIEYGHLLPSIKLPSGHRLLTPAVTYGKIKSTLKGGPKTAISGYGIFVTFLKKFSKRKWNFIKNNPEARVPLDETSYMRMGYGEDN
jgi:hypothetical protein